MTQPTPEQVAEALAYYDRRESDGLQWLNMGKALDALVPAYRAMEAERDEAHNQALFADNESKHQTARAELAERQYAELYTHYQTLLYQLAEHDTKRDELFANAIVMITQSTMTK